MVAVAPNASAPGAAESLAEFTSSIGKGALDRRAEITGTEEISALATSFNRMLERLAATLYREMSPKRPTGLKDDF